MEDVVVAITEGTLCAWATQLVRWSDRRPILVHDLPSLLEALVPPRSALVLGLRFDGVATYQILAMIRTAGCHVPVIVVAPKAARRAIARAILRPRSSARCGRPAPRDLPAG